MMDLDDMKDILAIDVIGVVPDDENVVISTNRGVPTVADDASFSGQAFRNISLRITGEDVPLMELDLDTSLMAKIKRLFGIK